MHVLVWIVTLCLAGLLGSGCDKNEVNQEPRLRESAMAVGARALEPLPAESDALVELGQALFFDPELSGNRDVSCATCHHPRFATVDAVPLSFGTGGSGLGPERTLGEGRDVIARNAPDLFNRSTPEFVTMFWDRRIEATEAGSIISPAGGYLPPEARTMFAAQAMFPVTSRDEMRGAIRDIDIHGNPNELAPILGSQPRKIWAALMQRLMTFEGYRTQFRAAFPDVKEDAFGFEHAARAMSAFQTRAFHLVDTPWDAYMGGDDNALTAAEIRGGELFFGEAGCARCHNGTLLSDQVPHNIGVPQIGPGKGAAAPLDLGFQVETGRTSDAFKFRTPPLRNVEMTGPYMHNGAYAELESTVRHHLSPREHYTSYDPSLLPEELKTTFQNSPDTIDAVFATLSGRLSPEREFTDAEIADIVAFLKALTSKTVARGELEKWTPESVPSGLEVER